MKPNEETKLASSPTLKRNKEGKYERTALRNPSNIEDEPFRETAKKIDSRYLVGF